MIILWWYHVLLWCRAQDAFLENDSNGFVQDELNRRQKVRNDKAKRQAQEAAEELDLDSSLHGGKWKEMHMSMAASSHSLSYLHSQKRVFCIWCVWTRIWFHFGHMIWFQHQSFSISLFFIECLHIDITHWFWHYFLSTTIYNKHSLKFILHFSIYNTI